MNSYSPAPSEGVGDILDAGFKFKCRNPYSNMMYRTGASAVASKEPNTDDWA